uniref:Adhesion G protein-coupled receptor E1-like n=1 Tax=Sphaeramia orbicularis TaxID=375764 RepID=A0A672ZNF2_9TELE
QSHPALKDFLLRKKSVWDECDIDPGDIGPCGLNANCLNAYGSFYCQCKAGFTAGQHTVNFSAESSASCRDINECLEGGHICGPNAQCINRIGDYSCSCKKGFISSTGVKTFLNNDNDNVTCTDINECEAGNVCGQNAVCTNTPGSYHCVCNPGFGLKSGQTTFSGNQEQCEGKGFKIIIFYTNDLCTSQINIPPPGRGNYFCMLLQYKYSIYNDYCLTGLTISSIYFLQSTENRTCVFWNSSEAGGTWSANGCDVVLEESNHTHTVCSCHHLSSFAVLMALYEIEDKFELQLITWVGLSLSLICLFICILTFSLIRSIQSPRTTIHLNLCISLFIAIVIFLAGISRTENPVGCAVVAGLLHFFYLAAFCWMCLEGIQLFRMVVLVFNTTFKPLYMMAGGYGVPAVIVTITALVNAKGYGTKRYCWLSLQSIWSFFGPACVIIIINIFFFLITVWKLAQKFSSLNPDLDNLQKIKAFIITAVAQLCVLGTMWIFGCFQFEEKTIIMSYLFTIFGSLQGVMLFVMHCLFSKQVREEYGNILSRFCAPQKKRYSEFGYSNSSKAHVRNRFYD